MGAVTELALSCNIMLNAFCVLNYFKTPWLLGSTQNPRADADCLLAEISDQADWLTTYALTTVGYGFPKDGYGIPAIAKNMTRPLANLDEPAAHLCTIMSTSLILHRCSTPSYWQPCTIGAPGPICTTGPIGTTGTIGTAGPSAGTVGTDIAKELGIGTFPAA